MDEKEKQTAAAVPESAKVVKKATTKPTVKKKVAVVGTTETNIAPKIATEKIVETPVETPKPDALDEVFSTFGINL
jgi:hypothetical protein